MSKKYPTHIIDRSEHLARVREVFGGTTLGRVELDGEFIDFENDRDEILRIGADAARRFAADAIAARAEAQAPGFLGQVFDFTPRPVNVNDCDLNYCMACEG